MLSSGLHNGQTYIYTNMQAAQRSLCSWISTKRTWNVQNTGFFLRRQKCIICYLLRRMAVDMVNSLVSCVLYEWLSLHQIRPLDLYRKFVLLSQSRGTIFMKGVTCNQSIEPIFMVHVTCTLQRTLMQSCLIFIQLILFLGEVYLSFIVCIQN